MIRIIVHTQDGSTVGAGVEGAKAVHSHATFDIEAPELETFMLAKPPFADRQIIGVEILKEWAGEL
jgi:hypothetical protein